jgi:hypothetical protein
MSACLSGLDVTLNRRPTNRCVWRAAVLVPTMTSRDKEFPAATDLTNMGGFLTEEPKEVVIAKANLVEHLRNIDAACDDARLSAVEKIKRIKEEVGKAQECLKRL